MPSAPVVYLDTQDYSRFGDVLRGKADAETVALFQELTKMKLAGDAVFAVSMPILAELLQYHPNFRETTMKKAEAVEQLCGGWALAYPSRLIAYEIARLAREKQLHEMGSSVSPLSSDWYWYPNVADAFTEMPRYLEEGMQVELEKLPMPRNRQERRARKSQVTKLDPVKAMHHAAPKMAAKFGIPADAVRASVAEFLQGKITAEKASRMLFCAICEPKTFVGTYFERVESKRDLPKWLRSVGDKFKVEFDK